MRVIISRDDRIFKTRDNLRSFFRCFKNVQGSLFIPSPSPMAQQPLVGQGLTITFRQTHHTRYASSRRVISPSQKPLPDKTKHSQQTDIHALGGIRTHNPSKRVAEDPRPRPHGHWDRFLFILQKIIPIFPQEQSKRAQIFSFLRTT